MIEPSSPWKTNLNTRRTFRIVYFCFEPLKGNESLLIHFLIISYRIKESNYDGSCRSQLKALHEKNPNDIVYMNGAIYWTLNRGVSSTVPHEIYRVNLTTKESVLFTNFCHWQLWWIQCESMWVIRMENDGSYQLGSYLSCMQYM